jgi:glucan 1,3-beta-glucosidase
VLAVSSALGLAFDPRYRDFPYPALSAAIVPLAAVSLRATRPGIGHGSAETLAAAVLALCAAYIVFNEGFANWQSLWFCALLVMLALILRRSPGGQS